MAAAKEPVAEFPVIIDLSVEDDPGASVLVRNRLMTRFKIDNAEAAYAKGATTAQVISVVIGTAMTNLIAHSPHLGKFSNSLAQDESSYATHSSFAAQQNI
jgi:hypothetical protein